MTALPHESLTQAEFPAWEQRQEAKHEFIDGHVYLYGVYGFAGGTQAHNALAMELAAKITPAVRPCRAYGSDMLIEMTRSTRYADLVVTCDERDHNPQSTVIRFPKLVIEVLSESTAKDDLGPKMREYQGIETLQEYVMLDSVKRWAQVLHREAGQWALSAPITAGKLELRSIDMRIDLDEMYALAEVRV